ncbi:MAG: VOC family protein [Candidatus Dormibacteria bacterium]
MRGEIDHLIYGVADLDQAMAGMAGRSGVRPALGGRHLGRGTANALLGLGGSSYLELLGPDAQREDTGAALPFGLDHLANPQLVAWAVRTRDLEAASSSMRELGWEPGEILEMEREQPDGSRLHWRLTIRPGEEMVCAYPFLIDWGDSPHPSTTAPSGLELLDLQLEDPEPERLRRVLEGIGVDVAVSWAPVPALTAQLQTTIGKIQLR